MSKNVENWIFAISIVIFVIIFSLLPQATTTNRRQNTRLTCATVLIKFVLLYALLLLLFRWSLSRCCYRVLFLFFVILLAHSLLSGFLTACNFCYDCVMLCYGSRNHHMGFQNEHQYLLYWTWRFVHKYALVRFILIQRSIVLKGKFFDKNAKIE